MLNFLLANVEQKLLNEKLDIWMLAGSKYRW